ncbi:MAG: apolipoprotein N-acyltransferase [Sphingomonadales bacterium]|nr:apolipoprotein N-acyltransferase [Sphingomonadales bacterium]
MVKSLDYAETGSRAFYVGGWFAFGMFAVGLYWVAYSFLAQTDVPQWTAPIAVMALAVALSVFVALSFVVAHKFGRFGPFGQRQPSRIIIFALSWALFEWLRGHMFTGFPWHQMAHVWSDTPVVMQTVSLLGSYGLSFLTVLVAASLVLFFDNKSTSRRAVMTVSLVVSIAVVGFGIIRLNGAEVSYYPDVRLRLVQANITQLEKWPREFWSRNVNQHIALSVDGTNAEEGADNSPTHVIWPETAVPYSLHSVEGVRSIIMGELGGNAHLITGVPRVDRDGQTGAVRLYNSIIGISPQGEVEMTYDKFHLVPFGEYIPFADVLGRLGIGKFVEGEVGFTSGPGPQTLNLSGLPSFSPLICYEIIFPSSVRQNNNASWILNLTNDAWFGDSFGPYQHFAQARFRAIEEGVAVVRVAGAGISGVIDPWGRVESKIGLFQQGYLDASLPKPTVSQPLYSKLGDISFAFIIILSLIGFAIIAKREEKQ